MKFTVDTEFVIIDDLYDESELDLIWQELDFITYANKLEGVDETQTSYDDDGKPRKKNKGIFLDRVYGQYRKMSNILTINSKLFRIMNSSKVFTDHLIFYPFYSVNHDTTLISYYENGDHYKPHPDRSSFTACTWFYREPKQFSGGDFIIHDYKNKKHLIEVKNNRCVVIRGSTRHEVTPVKCDIEKEFHGGGRYTMTQFMSIIDYDS